MSQCRSKEYIKQNYRNFFCESLHFSKESFSLWWGRKVKFQSDEFPEFNEGHVIFLSDPTITLHEQDCEWNAKLCVTRLSCNGIEFPASTLKLEILSKNYLHIAQTTKRLCRRVLIKFYPHIWRYGRVSTFGVIIKFQYSFTGWQLSAATERRTTTAEKENKTRRARSAHSLTMMLCIRWEKLFQLEFINLQRDERVKKTYTHISLLLHSHVPKYYLSSHTVGASCGWWWEVN